MEHDANAEPPHRESMLVELISRLFRDAETLLLQEFALARAEAGESLGHLVAGSLLLLAGVATALTGALAVIAALIILLSHVMPLWIACGLVGIVVLATGVVLALYGRRLVARASFVPRRTLKSLHETGEWAREELS